MRNKIFVTCLLLLMLSACALLPKETGKAHMFALGQAEIRKQGIIHADRLTVTLPVAAPELDTYRIALLKNEKTWDYYADARWVEFLPVIVQDDLVKTLESAGIFKAAATDQTGVPADWIMETSIRRFQAEYDLGHEAPLIRIQLVITLYRYPYQKAMASFEVEARKRAGIDSLSAIQNAFQAAFIEIQKKLVHDMVISLEKENVP